MVPMSYAQFLIKYLNGLNVLGDSLCLLGIELAILGILMQRGNRVT